MSVTMPVSMSVNLPHDASLQGHRVDAILGFLTTSTGIAFGIMTAIFLLALLLHRGRHRHAHYTHGNRKRDRWIAALAGAAVLIGIDAVAVVRSAHDLRSGFWRANDDDAGALRIEVTARQWAWQFRYAGGDDRFNTPDDIVSLNELRIPVNRPIALQLTSEDVVHSLYLPNFRTKMDAIPGSITRLWLQAKELGLFEVGCAQHCGAWHYKMRGELVVMDDDSFSRWSRRVAADVALSRQAVGASTPLEQPLGWAWKRAQ